jgi:hypothetical protein
LATLAYASRAGAPPSRQRYFESSLSGQPIQQPTWGSNSPAPAQTQAGVDLWLVLGWQGIFWLAHEEVVCRALYDARDRCRALSETLTSNMLELHMEAPTLGELFRLRYFAAFNCWAWRN